MTQATVRKAAFKASPSSGTEPVLVFESNLAGQHLRGAAFLAEKCHGAMAGKGWGQHGNSYAIPTSDKDLMPLGAAVITNYIHSFLQHAHAHPQLQFRVTALGFGNPNVDPGELIGMFARAPANCRLPGKWLERLGKLDQVRIIVLDVAGALREESVKKRLDGYFSINAPLWHDRTVEIVSTGPAMSVVANDKYARDKGFRHRIVSVHEAHYRNYLGLAREEMAVWHATHILNIAEPDQTSQGSTLRILQAAIRAGLAVEDITLGEQF